MDVTRRKLARILAATAVVSSETAAQTPPRTPGDSDAELNLARERMRSVAQRLATVSIPMATEPAFRFKP